MTATSQIRDMRDERYLLLYLAGRFGEQFEEMLRTAEKSCAPDIAETARALLDRIADKGV